MKITTVGIDLAKDVFQVHGVDERGKVVLKKQLKRHQVLVFFSNLPACLIGMEACGGAHFWARRLQGQGHTVRLMAPQFVKPYVKSNKNDAADAEAICEAVSRPNMRFVPIKNIEQQAALSLHRVRQGFIRERTALANRIRGLLAEFGLIIPQGIHHLARRMPEILEDADNELSDPMRALLARLLEHLQELNRQAQELEAQIIAWHRNNELSRKLEAVPGIGEAHSGALGAAERIGRQQDMTTENDAATPSQTLGPLYGFALMFPGSERTVEPDDPEALVDHAANVAYGHRASMLQDVLAHRRTEIDSLNGGIAALGRRCNVPTPLNDAIVALVQGLEASYG